VEKPDALAGMRGWNEGRIREAMRGTNRPVRLARPIPIYIVDFTTYARDGTLYFGNDIYERDRELVRIVERWALPPEREVQLPAELRRLVDWAACLGGRIGDLLDGGRIEQCGWLRDGYGLSWQIVPTVLGETMKDPDRRRAKRVMEVMLQMKKLDIARLERAYNAS
jgi:hypothetical protein